MQHAVVHSQYQSVVVVVGVMVAQPPPACTWTPALGGDATLREPENRSDRDDFC
jgi:hypothetical protein